MAARKRKSKRSLIVSAIVVVLILAIELGAHFGVLNWESLFGNFGLHNDNAFLSGTLEVYYLDVGNADCILLRQDEHAMMIDAGERGDYDAILSALRRHNVQRLDLVIATHPHADHIGSMEKIIQEVEIDRFLMSFMPEDETPTTSVYVNMLKALEQKDVSVTEVLPGDTYEFGGAQVHILAPINESDDPNAMSVVCRVDYGKHRFLFVGDAEEGVEKDMLSARADLKADVLKVGHHGSRTGTSTAFLQAVSPSYAVITCGAENAYGHPHKQVLDRLQKAQVKTLRSDIDGDITFVSDGVTLVDVTERGVE